MNQEHLQGKLPITSDDVNLLTKALSELRLKYFAEEVGSDLATMSESERKVIIKHFSKWATSEKTQRHAARIEALIRSAKFVTIQTVDTFAFNYTKSVQAIQKNYLSLYYSIAPDCLPSAIFTGTAGLGKTHLSRALGYASCQKSISVLFTTAATMVNELASAQKTFTLEQELKKYRRPSVLIIDELGYVALDAQASNLFFQVISARHDMKLGTIATTNLPFGKFNQIFANDAIAHAIIDRLVSAADVFYVEGPSYRDKEREVLRQKRRGK